MATCNYKTTYSKTDYKDFSFLVELSEGDPQIQDELINLVKSTYSTDIANAIVKAIENGNFNENWDYLPISSPRSVDDSININGAKNAIEESDEIESFYINSHNSTVRRDAMSKRFFEDIVSSTLFNRSTGEYFNPNTNKINEALYNYKVELLQKIWDFTGINHRNELNEEDFTRVISKTLAEYQQKQNDVGYENLYDDYVILKRFNKLLKDFTPFIKVDAAFDRSETHAKNMYIYDASGAYRKNWTDREDSSIEKVASPLVKLLADYFVTYTKDGKPIGSRIGFKSYNAIMSTLFRWIQEHRSDSRVSDIRNDIRKNGINANFEKIIDTYITLADPSENEKQILYGIKQQIFNRTSNIPIIIRDAFANHAFIQAKYAYISYRQNWEAGDYAVKGQYLEDSFIDTRSQSLHRLIQNKVWLLQKHNDLFEELCKKHNINVIDDNGKITVHFGDDWGTKPFNIVITKSNHNDTDSIKINSEGYDPKTINIEKTKILISDFLDRLIGEDFEDILHVISKSSDLETNLFEAFVNPIAIICSAVKEGRDNNYVYNYDENGFLRTYSFKEKLSTTIQYNSIADGVNELNVLQNGEGNNLPVYQLAPAIFDLFDVIDDLTDPNFGAMHLHSIIDEKISNLKNFQEVKNVLSENSFLKNKSLLKRILARSDVKIGNVVKSSDKLTEAEVAQLAFIDFYQNLNAVEGDLAGCIILQPIVYSDKKVHYLPVLDVSSEYISGRSVAEILKTISNPNRNRKSDIQLIEDHITKLRADKTSKQIKNQYLRFMNAISKIKDLSDNSKDYSILWDGVKQSSTTKGMFDAIAQILENFNKFENPLDIIREVFKKTDTTLHEDFDFHIVNGNIQANAILALNLKTYVTKDNLKQYIKTQKARLATDLTDCGVYLDIYTHPELKSYFNLFGSDSKSLWIDPYSGIMKNYRLIKDNQEIYFTLDQIQDGAIYNDPDITIELNPMIEGLFYANMLYGSQFNDIMFGGTEGYSPKFLERITDFESVDTSLLSQIFASSLSNEFKRTTFAGSVKRKYAQGKQFGVAKKANFAMFDDEEANISTLRGDTSKQVVQDGAGWVNGIMARMIQKSLVDSPVGDVRKTIAGWMDPRFGTQIHFKWAETTITMDLRQKSDGDGSAEVMYRKSMEAINIHDKFRKMNIDMKMFYNPNDNVPTYSIGDEKITTTKAIYRYDLNLGSYYKLDSITKNGDKLIGTWLECDEHGKLTGRRLPPREIVINTLYDIDRSLGGAFTYELDDDGNMQTSESVHDILYHLICVNDMKEDFVGYLVNRSAGKAGAINMNSQNTLNNDSEKIRFHYISTAGFGVLMDADHDLDFADVTEMSQMVSLLTQGGNNIELVNNIYNDIGKVAAKAMNDILAAVDTKAIEESGNAYKIYAIIGKALLDMFDTATKSELSLAQSFIRNAQNAILNETGLDNVILPYSSESIKGAFVTSVIALINKTGIKRKYAGFGGVQVPAEKTMQHYDFIINGERIQFDYRSMRDFIRPTLQRLGITWEQAKNNQIINGSLNPFLEVVDAKDVRFEDTIMYRPKGSLSEGTVIKLTTFAEFDLVRNLLGNDYEIYRWTIKPRELAQNDLRINTSEGTISEYDLDCVRASFYLSEYIDYRKKFVKGEDVSKHPWLVAQNRKIAVIQEAIKDNDLPGKDSKSLLNENDDFLKQCKKLLITKLQAYMNEVNSFVKSGSSGLLQIQMSQINDNVNNKYIIDEMGGISEKGVIFSGTNNITAQVVIGRRNFEKFGLRRGDKLSDIKVKGVKFFYDRLKQESDKSNLSTSIPNTRYDAVLRLGNNDKIIVLVGDQDVNFNYFGSNQEFRVSDNSVSYKGKVLFDNDKLENYNVRDFLYLSYVGENGETIPAIWVPDWGALDTIASSDAVKQYVYNFNAFNVESLLKHTQPEAFNEKGEAVNPIKIGETSYLVPNVLASIYGETSLNAEMLNPDFLKALNDNQNLRSDKELWRQATIMHRDFMHQLQMIQTRIPSQAMQSTMNIEVVDFADIDTNYIWVNKKIFKLQGSDLDIDKAYCMAYDVDDGGHIISLSDLSKFTEIVEDVNRKKIYKPKYDIDEILLFETPNKKKLSLNDGEVIFNFTDKFRTLIEQGVKRRGIILSELLSATAKLDGKNIKVVVDNMTAKEKNLLTDLIKDANIHNKSKRSKSEIESALRNRVLASARKIMNMPSSQPDAETPIDMEEPRRGSKLNINLGSKEKFMTTDNFMSIFIMQKQNMSGKSVIAMTATGIKSYFIVTTYYNTLAKQLEEQLNNYIDAIKRNTTGLMDPRESKEALAIADNIVSILNEISFDGKFNNNTLEPVLRTFANINFYDIKKVISKNKELFSIIKYGKQYEEFGYNTTFKNFAHNDTQTLDLEAIIAHLDKMANGNTWQINANGNYEYFKVNAPDSLSALLSAATDNAKELILEKLNATVELADLYITLLAQGVKFMDIASILTNKAFGIVTRFSKKDIFDSRTNKFSVENSIDFVLNDKTLPYLQKGTFEKFLTSTNKFTGFLGKLLDMDNQVLQLSLDGNTYNPVSTNLSEYIYDRFLIENSLTDQQILEDIKLPYGLINPENSAEKLRLLIKSGSNSNKNLLAKTLMNLFNDTKSFINIDGDVIKLSDFITNLLKNTLINSIRTSQNKQDQKPRGSDEEEAAIEEQLFDPTEMMLQALENPDENEDFLRNRNRVDNEWLDRDLTNFDLTNVYRYVIKYFIPKNQLWNSLDDDSKLNAVNSLRVIRDEILYSTQEMKMLGVEASINQGMKTGSFQEVNKIAQLETFVNKAYISRGKGKITEEFNLIKFINDPEYKERHINYYNIVKSSVNILKAIQTTGNFKEMFNYIGVSRKMIENSAAIRLERIFAKDILRITSNTDKNSGINLGATRKVNQSDFGVISRYVRDLITLNYFAINGKNLEFYVPIGQYYYDQYGNPGIMEKHFSLNLGNIHHIASFIYLMDNYIIPRMQIDDRFKDNKFIKNLSLSAEKDFKTKIPRLHYKLQDNINDSSNPDAKDKYDGILEDFNKLLYMPLNDSNHNYDIGDWTIGNLFFIYNLLVDKERISGNPITRLFNDLVSSNNKASLPFTYYKYLGELDRNEINIYDKDGNIDPTAFAFNIGDLQERLSGSINAYNYGVEEKKNSKGVVSKVGIKSSPESSLEWFDLETDIDKASDYVFGMRFLNKLEVSQKPKHVGKEFNSAERLTATSETVFNAITEELSSTYGKEIPMMIFSDGDIDSEFSDLDDKQLMLLKNSDGFIKNGCIYINSKRNNLEAPLHEMMHFVCALMKFNSDKNIRNQYYTWLDTIGQWIDGKIKDLRTSNDNSILNENSLDNLLGEDLKNRLLQRTSNYGNKHMSDVKEEVLVTLLGRMFRNKFEAVWGRDRKMTPQFVQANIKSALAKTFKNPNINSLLDEDLKDVPLVDILKNFASQLLSADSMLLDMSINENQELADLKDFLIKNGFISLSEECL